MKPHMKWSMLVAVVLMLVALAIYVVSDDEVLQPGVTPTTLPPANP